MKRYNVIIVYNTEENRILMCYRTKEPYKGLYNLVGGKIEKYESDLDSAYRELYEETNINKEDIQLYYLMNTFYKLDNIELQVYFGKLNNEVNLIDEVNTLHWIDIKSNFFDSTKFAGNGNIGHMIKQINMYKNIIFKK